MAMEYLNGTYHQFWAPSTAMLARVYLEKLGINNSISKVGVLVEVAIGNGTGLQDPARSLRSTQTWAEGL
jgi:hypothetical protein